MELLYAWMEKFRNFKEVNLNFSDKFMVDYNHTNKKIKIKTNTSYISIYPDHITNINAVVGRNSVGKTNLLDAIGLRTDDRNKNNGEFEIKYKEIQKKGSFYTNLYDIGTEIKHSIYFFLYYMGKDINNQDLFCIEGNDIDGFQNIIKKDLGTIDYDYFRGKRWFAFICNYNDGMLIHRSDLNESIIDWKRASNEDNLGTNDYMRSEQNRIAIISLRENLNKTYFDFNSTLPVDDYKISVPRRIAKFQSKFLSMKVEMLYKQLQKSKNLMFNDYKYTLKINYEDYFLKTGWDDRENLELGISYKDLDLEKRDICRLFESFVKFFYDNIGLNLTKKAREDIKKQVNLLRVKKQSLNEYMDYYLKVIIIISDNYFDETDEKQHIINCYKDLSIEIARNKNIIFQKNYMKLDITKKINIKEVLNVINLTIDEGMNSDLNEMFSVFKNFFSYSIENLSDGEAAYLGLYASLYEQISLLTPYKNKYIILLDEPEARMHPELTRNFLNELIFFLKDLSEDKKKFQIITSTHSPFILSDIPSNNIIYLEKDEFGYCNTEKIELNTFGTNIHTLLKDGFFMTSTMGEFATSKIKEIIFSINTYNIKDVTETQKNEWLYIINSIGEPLIQNRIMKMFNDKFQLDYTDLYNENLKLKGKLKKYEKPRQINETIEVLKGQIDQLQMHINELKGKN